jgi:3-hydroxyacyl-[acyl-carrier-protein] dehydratase
MFGCAFARQSAKEGQMTEAGCTNLNSPESAAAPARHLAAREDAALRDTLKHCSRCTYYAAYQFRLTGDPDRLPTLVLGVIERYVGPGLRSRLKRPDGEVLLSEDLGIDSLDLMEIMAVLEDALQLQIFDGERPALRTLADLRRRVESKAAGCTRFNP